MKPSLLLLLSFLIAHSSVSAEQRPTVLPIASAEVTGLRCEREAAPLDVDERSPRLSWQLTGSRHDLRQSAYQILAARTKADLEKGRLVWDSGKVASDQSIHVPYAGQRLESRGRYFWKVRVWTNQQDAPLQSPVAGWAMGLLEKSDWTAKWISAPPVHDWKSFIEDRRLRWKEQGIGHAKQTAPAPYLRKDFELAREVVDARVYVSGLGYYELFLNGRKIGDHVLDPAFTRYDKRVLYEVYDLSAALKSGRHVLAANLGDGWYNMHSVATWGFDQAVWRQPPTLRCQLEITYSDGSKETVVSDGSWLSHPSPTEFTSIRQGETYDARKEVKQWAEPGANLAAWVPVREVPGPAGTLRSQALPPIRVTAELKPVKITEPKPGVFVVDFGRNIAGWVKIALTGTRPGTKVTLKHAEKLTQDGLCDQSELDRHMRQPRFELDEYICAGRPTETWHPRFTYHGFQYVEVHGVQNKGDLENFRAQVLHTDFEVAGKFKSSSPLLNKIQEITLNAYVGNYHGYPTDCPHREKNGWTGDAHLAAQTGLLNYDSASAYAKWIQDFLEDQDEMGQLSCIVPTAGWGRFWGNGLAWDSAFILIPWYAYLYTGDTTILERNYDGFKKYFAFVEGKKSKDGITDFGLGDWSPPHTNDSGKVNTPSALTSTSYFYNNAVLLSRMAAILGKPGDEAFFTERAVKIREAFLKKFSKEGVLGNGSQTSYSSALYHELLPDAQRPDAVARLLKEIAAKQGHLDTGILGTKYLLRSLSAAGRSDVAYSIATKTTFPSWGHMVERGASTLWERWDGVDSQNHIMFGDISAWFYEYLAGIQPDERAPGFKHFYIKPFLPADLASVEASHRSLYGLIESSWTQVNGSAEFSISVPANTSATFVPPFKGAAITLNGQVLAGAEKDSVTGIKLVSGTHRISLVK